jgi:hypothetical protein
MINLDLFFFKKQEEEKKTSGRRPLKKKKDYKVMCAFDTFGCANGGTSNCWFGSISTCGEDGVFVWPRTNPVFSLLISESGRQKVPLD